MRTRILLSLITGLVLQGCSRTTADYRSQPADPEMLHAAMRQLSGVIVYDIFSPPQASRVYAYSSIAAYEALRPDYAAKYRTLAGQLNGLTPVPPPLPGVRYYLPLSSVHAFMTVGKAMTFSSAKMDSLRKVMEDKIRDKGIPSPVFDSSIAYGDRVAQHVLAWSKKDNYLQTRGMPKYTVLPTPGRWVPTPPAYMDGVEPSWGKIRPFVLDSATQFKPEPPPPFDTARNSAFMRQVMEVYNVRKTLTQEQQDIAGFWDCNPYTMHVRGHAMFATKKITPGGHWMGIAALASRMSHADMMRSAEVYARTAVALADGFIAVWEQKYRNNLARPETVINMYVDDQWEPALQTPPFPEYMSAHSVVSSAAAKVLTDEFGPTFAFNDNVEDDYGIRPRRFASFDQAAAEAVISRLYGGIHYRLAIEEGALQGAKIGDLVVRRVQMVTGRAPARTASLPRPPLN